MGTRDTLPRVHTVVSVSEQGQSVLLVPQLHTQDMHKTCTRHAQDMHKTRTRHGLTGTGCAVLEVVPTVTQCAC